MKLILLISSILLLNSCDTSVNYTNELNENLNGNFKIDFLLDTNISNFKATINFNDKSKEVSGFSACNGYFGSYTVTENTLNFGTFGSTKIYCADPINTIENQLFELLATVDSFTYANDVLNLIANKKTVVQATKI